MRTSAALLLVVACLLTACTDRTPDAPRLRLVVVATHRHDPAAFTEGLEIDGSTLYEGTGIAGHSSVRATDLATGAALAEAALPLPLFGEGITVTHASALWQLTWTDHTAIERDPRTLAERRRVDFDGEGWGLCSRRGTLVMSDGTNTLTFRDPTTFRPTGSVTVHWPDVRLNELDCAADGSVYANVWPTEQILRIDPDTGTVTAQIDATQLRQSPFDPDVGNVLNGIAQLPGTDRFLLTGKYWPTSFEVRFEPDAGR